MGTIWGPSGDHAGRAFAAPESGVRVSKPAAFVPTQVAAQLGDSRKSVTFR